MNKDLLFLGLAAACILILLVWRFSGGRYGGLRPSAKATADYGAFTVDPGLQYYTSGPDLHPAALMGIARPWRLDSDLWKRRDLDEKALKEIVTGMQAKAGERMASLCGFDILDHRGAPIGTFFSPLGVDAVVRIAGEDRVVVSAPRGYADPTP